MTYCVGMRLNGGLVFMSDTRTNAGFDNFSSARKMFNSAAETLCCASRMLGWLRTANAFASAILRETGAALTALLAVRGIRSVVMAIVVLLLLLLLLWLAVAVPLSEGA